MSFSPNYYYNKPNYGQHFRYSDGFKQPFNSPPNNGYAFSPYNYSSPKQLSIGVGFKLYDREGRMRYQNRPSPYNLNRNNRNTYHQNNRRSYESQTATSGYYDPSMVENPWAELEKEFEEKKKLELSAESAESSDTSTK